MKKCTDNGKRVKGAMQAAAKGKAPTKTYGKPKK